MVLLHSQAIAVLCAACFGDKEELSHLMASSVPSHPAPGPGCSEAEAASILGRSKLLRGAEGLLHKTGGADGVTAILTFSWGLWRESTLSFLSVLSSVRPPCPEAPRLL